MSSLPHTQSPDQLFKFWSVDPTLGLSSDQVVQNRKLFGENGTISLSLRCTFWLVETDPDDETFIINF